MFDSMYILNTSFMVDYDVHDHWLEMFRKRFIPFLQGEGFTGLVFTKVMTNSPDDGHFTYSLQVAMPDLARYEEFNQRILGEFAEIAVPVYGEKVLWFSSLLKHVDF